MELHGHEIIAGDRRRNLLTSVGDGGGFKAGVGGIDVVGVNEIHPGGVGEIIPEGNPSLLEVEGVPPHMRNSDSRFMTEAAHDSGDNA